MHYAGRGTHDDPDRSVEATLVCPVARPTTF
jgi:hypothetical protein